MKAVQRVVVLISDNAMVVAHKTAERHLFFESVQPAQEILTWTELFMIFLTAQYILGKNILINLLFRPDQVLLTEWSLLHLVFSAICKEYGRPLIDLFATRANVNLLSYASPVPDPMAWKKDAFQHSWDDLSIYAFPLCVHLKQILLRVLIYQNLFMIMAAPLWPQKEWFADLLSLLVDVPFELTMPWNRLVQPRMRKFHRGPGLQRFHARILSSNSSKKQAFVSRLQNTLSLDLRKCPACLYQGKWSRFFHLCHCRNIAPCKATLQQLAEFFLYP